jgi:hypothetical protein
MGNTCNRVVPTKNKSEENFRVKDQTKVVKFCDKNLFYSHPNSVNNSEKPDVAQKIYISDRSSEAIHKAFKENIVKALLRAKSDMDDAALEDMRKSQGYSIVPYVLLDT